MGFLKNKKLIIAFVSVVLAVSIPLTLFLLQQKQDTRSKAGAASTLSFAPTTPITVGSDVPLEIKLDPGNDLVSYVRVHVTYDPTVLELSTTNPFTPNTASFPVQVQPPVASSGAVIVTVSIGSDTTKIVQAPTSVGTLHFKAINTTGSNTSAVSFGNLTQILSSASDDNPTDNVLSTAIPAAVTITEASSEPTHTPTPTPATTSSPSITAEPTNALTPTESISPTLAPTGIGGGPTDAPTATSMPTAEPTNIIPKTQIGLDIMLHAIGSGGDNANPFGNSFSNKNPQHSTRSATVSFYNQSNAFVGSISGEIVYSSASGSFKGIFDIASSMVANNGLYTMRITSDNHLARRIPGIVQLTVNQLNQIPSIQLVAGDANNDNALNILDYNILMGCYGSFSTPVACDPAKKIAADFNDDGNVDHIDYNLFLRELSHNLGD